VFGITISVAGTCKENIQIIGFDHLLLQGTSKGTQPSNLTGRSTSSALKGVSHSGYSADLSGARSEPKGLPPLEETALAFRLEQRAAHQVLQYRIA